MSRPKEYTREASHAGSWYEGSAARLAKQLDGWLDARLAEIPTESLWTAASGAFPLALIGPHAGYRYSGPTAAAAYTIIDGARYKSTATSAAASTSATDSVTPVIDTIVILGPSHRVFIDGCALPSAEAYATPLGNLRVNTEIMSQLAATKAFKHISQEDDEAEHSLEMHLPILVRALQRGDPKACDRVTIVPIVVGRLHREKEAEYAKLLAPIVSTPGTFVVVSSDFCHWGDRFDFTNLDAAAMRSKPGGIIADGIEAMDRRGMQLIEARDLKGFQAYLKATGNTICGRNPIELLLATLDVVDASKTKATVSFLAYAQSGRVATPDDSSVSYASAAVYLGK